MDYGYQGPALKLRAQKLANLQEFYYVFFKSNSDLYDEITINPSINCNTFIFKYCWNWIQACSFLRLLSRTKKVVIWCWSNSPMSNTCCEFIITLIFKTLCKKLPLIPKSLFSNVWKSSKLRKLKKKGDSSVSTQTVPCQVYWRLAFQGDGVLTSGPN